MGKLGRFLKLERARPESDETVPLEPATSGRFARLEPRRDEPPEPPADPFQPPPEREVPLEIADDVAPPSDKAKAEKRSRAEAELAEARELADLEQLARDEAKPDLATRTLDPIVRASNTNRWLVLGGGTVVIAFGALIVGPIVWGLMPILLAVVIGSALAAKD